MREKKNCYTYCDYKSRLKERKYFRACRGEKYQRHETLFWNKVTCTFKRFGVHSTVTRVRKHLKYLKWKGVIF